MTVSSLQSNEKSWTRKLTRLIKWKAMIDGVPTKLRKKIGRTVCKWSVQGCRSICLFCRWHVLIQHLKRWQNCKPTWIFFKTNNVKLLTTFVQFVLNIKRQITLMFVSVLRSANSVLFWEDLPLSLVFFKTRFICLWSQASIKFVRNLKL